MLTMTDVVRPVISTTPITAAVSATARPLRDALPRLPGSAYCEMMAHVRSSALSSDRMLPASTPHTTATPTSTNRLETMTSTSTTSFHSDDSCASVRSRITGWCTQSQSNAVSTSTASATTHASPPAPQIRSCNPSLRHAISTANSTTNE